MFTNCFHISYLIALLLLKRDMVVVKYYISKIHYVGNKDEKLFEQDSMLLPLQGYPIWTSLFAATPKLIKVLELDIRRL